MPEPALALEKERLRAISTKHARMGKYTLRVAYQSMHARPTDDLRVGNFCPHFSDKPLGQQASISAYSRYALTEIQALHVRL